MKQTFPLMLILALGAPAAAELAAPQLPLIGAAAARALPFETGEVRPAFAKDFFFGGPAVTPVEDADYICQNDGGGFALRAAGRSSKIWQLDGLASGAEEGIQLGKVSVDLAGMPERLQARGYLSFGDQELRIDLDLKKDQKTGGMALTARLNGQASPITNVPCRAPAAAKAFGGPRVYAEGTLFAYNRSSGKYDEPTGRTCSVTLDNFKSYLDTEHGSPREVVSARYRLEGFPGNGGWTAGTALGGPPSKEYPYVTFEGYQSGGLVTGTRVNILVEDVPSAQALLAGQAPPTDVYAVKENSASSYFGGDGVKWGYRCALPGGRP